MGKKGFTLVELLVVLGLFGIIISLVMSLFITNLKSYETINNYTELQFQSQYILNFMANKILESKYIELAKANTSSHLKKTGERKITKISFRYGIKRNQCYNFEIKNNKIYYGNTCSFYCPTIELGCYIRELKVEPICGKKFKDSDAIRIILILEKDKQIYETEQTVHMRNFNKVI